MSNRGPTPSPSRPSFPGNRSESGPKLSVPTAQSSHVSPSLSPQASGLNGAGSEPSRTPSLSSSESPALQRPSPSVSAPSLAGSVSARGPKSSVPTAQSSQVSASLSPQTSGFTVAGSAASSTPSLSSSGSTQSAAPSPSASVPEADSGVPQ